MKSVWSTHVRTLMEMNPQRNAYANPLERTYAVTDLLRLSKGTFYTPTKG